MAGAKGGVLAHSQSFTMERISINGRAVGEIGQTAAIAGYFHIPVVMLAGDQAACDELRELQPKAETVAVKRLAGKGSTLSLSHPEAKTQIQAAAARAVKRISEFTPWNVGRSGRDGVPVPSERQGNSGAPGGVQRAECAGGL